MINRADQNWPEGYTVELREPSDTQKYDGHLIADLTETVARAESRENMTTTIQIATMYRLNWRGEITETRYCHYHGAEWMQLVEQHWITHTVTDFQTESEPTDEMERRTR